MKHEMARKYLGESVELINEKREPISGDTKKLFDNLGSFEKDFRKSEESFLKKQTNMANKLVKDMVGKKWQTPYSEKITILKVGKPTLDTTDNIVMIKFIATCDDPGSFVSSWGKGDTIEMGWLCSGPYEREKGGMFHELGRSETVAYLVD